MLDTNAYRVKYARRPHARGVSALPAGGADVLRLCEAVDALMRLVRDIQRQLPTDEQNAIERRLWMA